MKTITIELDQFREHLDDILAEAERGELILTRQGKPWFVMRPAFRERDGEIPKGAESPGESAGEPHGSHETPVSLVGKTISWVREYLGKTCTISLEAMAFVDGKRVSEDFELQEGQVLEFSEQEEEEEWVREMYKTPEFWEMLTQRRSDEAIPWEEAKRRLGLD
jgi:antitoxin (DNA-binding transcriptional repressor) of toxin-antitoxin stability system